MKKNTFLHGELNWVIYMNQPISFQCQDHPKSVCELWKTLYRLEKASRAWYDIRLLKLFTYSSYLVTPVDSRLFVNFNERKLVVMLM